MVKVNYSQVFLYFCSPKNGEVAQVVRAQDS